MKPLELLLLLLELLLDAPDPEFELPEALDAPPTVPLMAVTVPAWGAVSVALLRLSCAVLS
jgi:hypothetical protein